MRFRKTLVGLAAILAFSISASPAIANDNSAKPTVGNGVVNRTVPPQANINDFPHGKFPPSIPSNQYKLTDHYSAAQIAANMKFLKAHPKPANLVPTTKVAQARPWGGEEWSGWNSTSEGGNNLVHGCSWGATMVSADGRLFGQTAGHCVTSEDGSRLEMSPTGGKFWYPYTTAVIGATPTLGNAGFAAATFNSPGGDKMAIRDNLVKPLYAQVATWDTRGAVNLVAMTNPAVGMSASQSGNTTKRLIKGVVSQINVSTTFVGHPGLVNNQAIMTVDNTTQGCSQAGDSGGTMVDSNHFFIGTVSGSSLSVDKRTCFIYFDMGLNSANKMSLRLAPIPPV